VSEPIDVVIPYRLENDGQELRYAIRSIQRFFTPLGRIWVVGDRPSWLQPDGDRLIHLNIGPICRIADVDIWHKLMVACLHPRPQLTERFVFWSDDQMALRPIGWKQLGPYHFGDLAELSPWPTGGPYHDWWQRMRHTMEFLRRSGKTTLHGDTHCPLPMERDGVVRLLQSVPWKQAPGLCVGTLWLNWTGLAAQARPMDARKTDITQPLGVQELRQQLAGRWFLCHTPAGWTGELRSVIDQVLEKTEFQHRVPTARLHLVSKRPLDSLEEVFIPNDQLTNSLPYPYCKWRAYNASIIRAKNKTLLAYRIGPHWGSGNAICELDQNYFPIQGTVRLLPQAHGKWLSYEDPRLMRASDGTIMVQETLYKGIKQSPVIQLAIAKYKDGEMTDGRFLKCETPQKVEKNWIWFEFGGQEWISYSIWRNRHCVMVKDDSMNLFRQRYDTEFLVPWKGAELRGGTPFVEADGLWFSFAHTRYVADRKAIYEVTPIVVEPNPPFRVVGVGRGPLPLDLSTGFLRSDKWFLYITFPLGAILDQDNWIISAGHNDWDVKLIKVPHKELKRWIAFAKQ